jgi:argininosuccinate lyase
MTRLWDKGAPLDQRILAFTAGEDHRLDERLVPYDVRASVAHAQMLAQQGLLAARDCESLCAALRTLGEAHAAGEWAIELADEDVHTALERRLIERVGAIGGAIHLGRSRNDQVLAALRLYLCDAADMLAHGAERAANAVEQLANAQGDVPLPGYTHMQPAMPSSVALWAGGFASELRDDAEGLRGAKRRADLNPLGSAAGYGVPGLPLDREATRRSLGFTRVHEPVTAVQLSRGKAEASLVFEIVMLLGDLSRLAADLLVYYMHELAYVSLPQTMTTGSSIMPQKRNPDVFELVRASQSTATGSLIEMLNVSAKLTSGYHRDLQRLKAPLFRSIDLAQSVIEIMAYTLPEVRFNRDNIELDDSLYAAQRANELVLREGLTFREAYRRVAEDLARKTR